MLTIPSKFSTRRLILSYKPPLAKHRDSSLWKEFFNKAMKDLFGDAYDAYNSSYVFWVPASCDFIEIDAALSREFAKYPSLKGMRFRLQVQDKMVVV